MSVKNLDYKWLGVILLSLVFTNLNGCDNNAQEQATEGKLGDSHQVFCHFLSW